MKIAVAIVHGIGQQKKNFAEEFILKIKQAYLNKVGYCNLEFEAICWQESIEPIEENLYAKISKLGWTSLRNHFVEYAGDALGYQSSNVSGHGFYDLVHKSFDVGLNNLSQRVEKNSPLCIISHSLGTIVTSNFIWDCQHQSDRNTYNPNDVSVDLVNRLELLYTMGSPLAVWSMRFPQGGDPIYVPDFAKWFNLYNRNDIIGSPIKIINQQYNSMPNLFDVETRVGSILTKWNPISHGSYWDSSYIINHITSNLIKLNTFYSI